MTLVPEHPSQNVRARQVSRSIATNMPHPRSQECCCGGEAAHVARRWRGRRFSPLTGHIPAQPGGQSPGQGSGARVQGCRLTESAASPHPEPGSGSLLPCCYPSFGPHYALLPAGSVL